MPQNDIARQDEAGVLIESLITKGDLAKLSPKERTDYYVRVCQSVGLNPFTRPFEYINLSGKLTLYARRDAADQLSLGFQVPSSLTILTIIAGLVRHCVHSAAPCRIS